MIDPMHLNWGVISLYYRKWSDHEEMIWQPQNPKPYCIFIRLKEFADDIRARALGLLLPNGFDSLTWDKSPKLTK